MSFMKWEPKAAKAQVRTTTQRLGQLQERMDSQGAATRREIATLLQQGNVGLARTRAQSLLDDDATGDLLEMLEMHLGLVLEHFQELEVHLSPSPTMVEAASSIIFAAPRIESSDLHETRDLLIQRLGEEFARSAAGNLNYHVSPRVVEALTTPPPTAAQLDEYMTKLASKHNVIWKPEPSRHEILTTLTDILDPAGSPMVDVTLLRTVCAKGIPDDPPWLRPRIWKLFFNYLPVLKSSWAQAAQKQRDDYYELVRRLLVPFSAFPAPSSPLSHSDETLLSVSHQLSRLLPGVFEALEQEPAPSAASPLNSDAPDDIRIPCAGNLDVRLAAIRDRHPQDVNTASIPEIRLEGVSDPSVSESERFSGRRKLPPPLLAASNPYNNKAHPKHMTALLRLLFVHFSINPGSLSPHIPSLLVPLYSVLCQDVEASDHAHVEADTFWLFESIVGEFSELEDEEGGTTWMKKLGDRLAWADPELKKSLHEKGLDPSLPHYSYRWLAPLLTQTLPLPTTIILWDAMFSCQMRERNSNPKLDFLLDICTGMLIRAKAVLLRLGKKGHKSIGLWGEEATFIAPPSPIRAWELGDAFLEGMSLLQAYPIDAAGGVDRLLQTACDLTKRRLDEARSAATEPTTLAGRLKVSVWKGFTNQQASPSGSPYSSDTSDEEDSTPDEVDVSQPAAPPANRITSRLANTVWRGITNQSSMSPPPTPISPAAPQHPPEPLDLQHEPNSPLFSPATIEANLSPKLSLWGYAEKLKDSDTAAAISKVGSNWRAKAMMGTWSVGRSTLSPPAEEDEFQSVPGRRATSENGAYNSSVVSEDGRRGSLPGVNRSDIYSPPAMPAFFRPPRDSGNFSGLGPVFASPTSPPSGDGGATEGLLSKTKNLQASLAALTRPQSTQPQKTPKASGPRPLLLGTASVTAGSRLSRSANSTPTPDRQGSASASQWGEVLRTKDIHRQQRDSVSSSMSSALSPSDAHRRQTGTGFDSDSGSSRIIPIGRRSLSPNSQTFRLPSIPADRPMSLSSNSVTSDASPPLGRPGAGKRSDSGWGQIDDVFDSPPTPVTTTSPEGIIVQEPESIRGSLVLKEPITSTMEPPMPVKKLVRKKTPPSAAFFTTDDTSDSSIAPPTRTSRVRSKRHPNRPTNLRLSEVNGRKNSSESPNTLGVEWPEEAEVVTTPKATNFDSDPFDVAPAGGRRRKTSGDTIVRKGSNDTQEPRVRKISASRARKMSAETKEKRQRQSMAEEGDDEGYDDLLSAYESEEGVSKSFADFMK